MTVDGTQTIAWDPQTGQLRSWLNNDDGGHGRSLWSRDGNRWVLESLGVLPDGRETATSNGCWSACSSPSSNSSST